MVREFCQVGFAFVHAVQLFAEQHRTRLDRGQVEAHVQVGGAGAAFHVEYLHGVGGVVLEHPLAVVVEFEFLVYLALGLFRRIAAADIIIVEDIL